MNVVVVVNDDNNVDNIVVVVVFIVFTSVCNLHVVNYIESKEGTHTKCGDFR